MTNGDRDPRKRIGVHTPEDLLAAVPPLLGFVPGDSMVVLGLSTQGDTRRVEVIFRYNLVENDEGRQAAAEHAVRALSAHADSCVLVGYGDGQQVTPQINAIIHLATATGFAVYEALRVEGNRYWGYLCQDPPCPPEGVPFDLKNNRVSAEFAYEGMGALPGPDAVAQCIAPPTGEALAAAQTESRDALDVWAGTTESNRNQLGLAAVADALAAYREREGYQEAKLPTLTWLAVCLSSTRVRDDAWSHLFPEHRKAYLQLWTDVVAMVDPAIVAPAASLLAFVAWQNGEGTLANAALDRALSAESDYPMARLMIEIIVAGIPPSKLALPMNPEQVAKAYAKRARERE